MDLIFTVYTALTPAVVLVFIMSFLGKSKWLYSKGKLNGIFNFSCISLALLFITLILHWLVLAQVFHVDFDDAASAFGAIGNFVLSVLAYLVAVSVYIFRKLCITNRST